MNKIIILFSVLIFSCSSKSSKLDSDYGKLDGNHVIDFKGSFLDNDLDIKPISLTALAQPNMFKGFSENIKLQERDNIFYVFDLEQQFLIKFDSLGNMLGQIGKKGRGPAELLGVIDFAVRDDEVCFLRRAGNKVVFLVFDLEGNYLYNKEAPSSGISFAQYASGDYIIFTGWNSKEVPNKLMRVNPSTGEFINFFPHEFDEPKISMSGDDNFTNLNGDIYFNETLKPEIFRVTEASELELFAFIDMGDLAVDNEFWSLPPFPAAETLFDQAFYRRRYFWITEDKVIMEGVVSKDNGENQNIVLTVHQTNNGITKTKILERDTIDELFLNIFTINKNHMYSLADGYVIEQLNLEKDLGVSISDSAYYLVKSEIKFN